jgi:hypothetical protein
VTQYKALILIDRDGMETRDERRTLTEGKLAFTKYLVNAATDNTFFSVTLINCETDEIISNWER